MAVGAVRGVAGRPDDVKGIALGVGGVPCMLCEWALRVVRLQHEWLARSRDDGGHVQTRYLGRRCGVSHGVGRLHVAHLCCPAHASEPCACNVPRTVGALTPSGLLALGRYLGLRTASPAIGERLHDARRMSGVYVAG